MPLPDPRPASTVLITGASSGIGCAFARQLAERGHNVTLVARREHRLEKLAAEVRERYQVRAEPLPCDLTHPEERAALPGRIAELGLRTDVLVSNAGIATGGPFAESDLEMELEQVRVLCEATVHLVGLFMPPMVERREGTVICVASTAGMQPLPNSAGYSAAKAHQLAFAEAVHMEVRRHGVTVTAVCPGPVRTELFEKYDHPVERLPSPLWVDAPEVARSAIAGAENGKRVVVPGLLVRAGAPLARLAPRAFELRLVERLFR
jgi:short-subunit dehydrogenase